MVETFFKRSCTIHGLRQGPLAGHIDLLADHLAAHGFLRGGICLLGRAVHSE
jgi:hypothetical protein